MSFINREIYESNELLKVIAKDSSDSLQQLNSISSDISDILTTGSLYQSFSSWDIIPGNSKEFTYYAGVEAGNPSGATTNIKTVVYKTGVSTIVTQTFTYDAGNKVLSITAS